MTRQTLTLAIAVLGLAAVGSLLRASDNHPFGGTLDLSITGVTPGNGVLVIDATVSGHANGLGHFTGPATYFVAPDGTFVGFLTKIAANGDELHKTFDGYFIDPVPTGSAGTFAVVGGTGRFTNATGGGRFDNTFTSPVTGETEFSGAISFNASDRR